jgi:hypothetical protein
MDKPPSGWTSFPLNPGYPWGIWTANGKHCFSVGGGTYLDVNSKWVTFSCGNDGALLGKVDTSTHPWTIEYVSIPFRQIPAGNPHRSAVRVGITDVWR